jgi:hypothetical protein
VKTQLNNEFSLRTDQDQDPWFGIVDPKIRIRDNNDRNPEPQGKYNIGNDSQLLLIQILVWDLPGDFKK